MDSKVLPITAAALGGTVLLFICLVAYLITLPLSWFTADNQDLLALRQEYQGVGGGSGAALAAVAEQEYARYGGTACGSRYWPGGPEAWCCDFVYWCADQLGYVGQGQPFGTWTAYCPTAVSNLEAAGAEIYYPGDGTVPQPGDIIFFSAAYGRPGRASDGVSTDADHIGIVVEGTDSTVTVVEGNTGGGGPSASKLSRNTYSLTGPSWRSTYILSLWRPCYPRGAGGNGMFYFQISNPDPSYTGCAMDCTEIERAGVIRTLYFEYGMNLEGCILVAQSIRDNSLYNTGSIQNTITRLYQPYGTRTYWTTWTGDMDLGSQAYQNALRAFDYVFVQGGSAVQHKIFCYYTPLGSVQTDADFQRNFQLPLTFVFQLGSARFFSWEA